MNWKEEEGRTKVGQFSEMGLEVQNKNHGLLELDILVIPLKMNPCGSFYSLSTLRIMCLERSAVE